MDITFYKNECVFNHRTCGVFVNNNKILLHKMRDDDFWTLPGGRVKLLESSEDAIKREISEELGENAQVNRLLWMVENFFEIDKKNYHEILTIYYLKPSKESSLLNKKDMFNGIEGERLVYKWFDIDELDDLNVKPKFLKLNLKCLPESMEHIINKE